jgi:hypothetical protein
MAVMSVRIFPLLRMVLATANVKLIPRLLEHIRPFPKYAAKQHFVAPVVHKNVNSISSTRLIEKTDFRDACHMKRALIRNPRNM